MAQQWTPCDCCKAKIRKVTEPFERAIQELNIRKRVEQCSDNTREEVKLLERYTEILKKLQDIILLSNHTYKQKLGVKEDEARRSNNKVKQLQQEICDLKTQIEKAAQKLNVREDEVRRSNEKVKQLQQEIRDLKTQIETDAQRIANDGSKIQKLQHNQDVSRLEMASKDQVILKLQTDLDASKKNYTGCSEKVRRRDESIKQLQEELMDSQAQYSACYNELLKTQNYIQQLKTKSCVNQATQASSQESSQLQDQLFLIKQELAISREKHRTCQKEVATRDQEIQKLQTDLSMTQGKYIGCMEGLNIREDKVIRLNDKVAHLQIEILDLSAKIEGDSQKIAYGESTIRKFQHNEELFIQEVIRRNESIKQLQEELMDSQAQYSDCYNELLKTQNYIQQLKTKSCVNQATQASSQESSQLLDQLFLINQELAISREKHRTCQKEVATRDQEIQKLQTDLSLTQGKYIGCMEGLNIREDKVIRLNDKVTELQIKILDLSAKIEGDSQKIANGESTIQNFQHDQEFLVEEVIRRDESIKQLQEELMDSQAQYIDCHNELLKTQNYIQQLKTKSCVNQATQASSQESSQLQDQLLLIKQELAISREKHRTCQKEVATRDQEIQELQTDLSMTQAKYIGCVEELNIREDKAIRLNDKVTQLQIEILDLNAKIEADSQKIAYGESTIRKFQHNEEIFIQEVRRRNVSIKQLQQELMDSQAQYSACYNELNIREDKVIRLNDKVTQLQKEVLDLSTQIEGDSQKVSDGEKTIQELQHDQEITKGSLKVIVGMYHARGEQDIETIRKQQSTISHLMEEIRSLHCALDSQRDQNRELEHSMQQMEDHQEERSLHHEMDFQQARMIITQLQRKLGQTEADHDEEINHLKLTFEERLRYHLPLSVRQDLEDTIKALKSQNKSLQQKVVILQEWLDELS